MSPRQSKSGSRSAGRTRGARAGGTSARRSNSHSRSLSARGRVASNTSRAASKRRGSGKRHEISTRGTRGVRVGLRRGDSSASHAVKLLKQDHRAVAHALQQFESADREDKQAIARRICKMLTVHAQIEEELLYPAARDALRSEDAHLVSEARVEHASLKDLIGQIEEREEMDEQYEAKVCVLGEYVKHHVAEEEHEIFPRLERSSLDLEALGERLEERKRELMSTEAEAWQDGQGTRREDGGMFASIMPSGRSRSRSQRSTGLHARRR
jgi:hemerythrin superfamily protein